MEQAGPGVMFGGLNACNNYTAGLDQAEKVTAATTMILGERDMMTSPAGAKLVAKALNAETIILPNCGHMMLAEQHITSDVESDVLRADCYFIICC